MLFICDWHAWARGISGLIILRCCKTIIITIMRGVGKDDQKTIKRWLFKSNGSSFTSNLCGFLNGVDKRILLTREGSSPLTKTFISQLGEILCVDDELNKNHRQKLGLVCKMRGKNSQSKLLTPK